MSKSMIIGLSVVALAAVGVFVYSDVSRTQEAQRKRDAWFRPPPDDVNRSFDKPLEFAVVLANKRDDLVARLADTPFVELSPAEAEQLAGKAIEGTGGKLILVRALEQQTGTGNYKVLWYDGCVEVLHGALGRRAVPVARQALIVRVPDLPKVIFVTTEFAS